MDIVGGFTLLLTRGFGEYFGLNSRSIVCMKDCFQENLSNKLHRCFSESH